MPTEIKAQNTTTLASVKAIYDAADEANTLLDGMQTAATAAGTTLNGIYADAEAAQASAENASEYAARALGNLASVQSVTETLNWITAHGTMTLTSDVALDPTHVYFVVDPAGDYVVGGTHYSVVTEPDVDDISTYYELSINESLNNYVATHLAVDSEGLWIIPDAGGNKVLIATGSGSTYTTAGTYIVGKVGGVDTVLAEFTASGAQIGQNANGQTRTVLSTGGMQVIQNVGGADTQIVNLGFGAGKDEHGSTSDAPYYTLGRRNSLFPNAVGNYSVAEGVDVIAAGYGSHAEGGAQSAIGEFSHAEGDGTIASGDNSHASGEGTQALGKNQTVIGRFNYLTDATKDDYPFIIGNGTESPWVPSNALTVDWSGNVEAAGDVTDGAGNTLSAVAASVPVIAVETKTLATSVNVSANSTTSSYNIPTKSGYTVAAVTPMVTGSYNGQYFAAITTSDNNVPTSLYFKNTHSSAHTNSFYIRVVYIKN